MIAPIHKLGLQFLVLVVSWAVIAGSAALGQTNTHSTQAQNGAAAGRETIKQKRLPYRGKVAAVDKGSHSFTVGKRTFFLTAETKLWKNSQSVRLDQLSIGEWVTGSYTRRTDGKLVAATVYVGGKNDASKSK